MQLAAARASLPGLWQSSRLELNLIPTHPDRAAGLGFFSGSSNAFAPLFMAHSTLFAGLVANPISRNSLEL